MIGDGSTAKRAKRIRLKNGVAGEYERYRAEQAARYMEHVGPLGSRIRMLREEVEAQRALVESVRGIDYASIGGGGSPSADAVPDAVIRLQGLVSDYCTELAGYMGERRAGRRMRSCADSDALCRTRRCWRIACAVNPGRRSACLCITRGRA